jgi:MFS family permease
MTTENGIATGGAVAAERPVPLRRDQGFRMLFAAAIASKTGTQIGYVALPLVAIDTLDASPGQVGLLSTLNTVAFLVIGLPAGAWVDRMRHRRVMVVADLVRFLVLVSVPVAGWLGVISVGQLYAVALAAGCATVFFDVAAQSSLPYLVGRERIFQANAQLNSWDAALTVGGRGGGGFLVQALTPPVAVLTNALGFLGSALFLKRIKKPDERPAREPRRNLVAEVGEGVRFVFRHQVLRPIAIAGSLTNLCVNAITTMIPVLFRDDLHLPVWSVGVFISVGGVGAFLGTFTARRVGERIGVGRSLWILGLATSPFALMVALVDHGMWMWVAGGAWLVVTFRIGINNVMLVSFRQQVTPDGLLGRVNATMRFLLFGALSIGAGVAAVVGEYASPRAALWTGAVGLACAWIPLFLSPLRTMRRLTD